MGNCSVMPNRLAAEASPYLLQHANNPVDWYPWGDEAFVKAQREEKPIFLSIGYSTCHWCHVMEHESFESSDIADALNRDFVAIKVDREERPDVDRVYMTFVQATTGSGGWPMSVWLTPDLKPFFGGTYFPPSSRWGRPGFVDILTEITRVWKEERDSVVQSAATLIERLRAPQDHTGGVGLAASAEAIAGPEVLTQGVEQFERAFDRRNGGFGAAPKFPRPSEFLFLLREHARTGGPVNPAKNDTRATWRFRRYVPWHWAECETISAVDFIATRLTPSGACRISRRCCTTRRSWRLPTWRRRRPVEMPSTASVAEDTLNYVRREMTDSAGGFYSAEDADSVPPEHAGEAGARKSEGAFYIWRDSEIAALFGDEADVVRFRFGIEGNGNAPHDPQGEFTHKNLLYVAGTIEDVARMTGRPAEAVMGVLGRAREVMVTVRSGRPRPHRDDKILAAWNGLMIAAFARAVRGLGASAPDGFRTSRSAGLQACQTGFETRARDGTPQVAAFLESARAAAGFVRSTLWDDRKGVLLRRYRGGQAAIDGYSEDYAFLVWGLLELFQADADPVWLEWALGLQAKQDELFWDAAEGGWFNTTGQDPSVLLRLKEDYDGAEPSASSVSVMNLLTLSHLTGDAGAAEKVERTLRGFGTRFGQAARAVPMMMCALSTRHAGVQQVVIVGRRGGEDVRVMLAALSELYLPFAVTIVVEPGEHQMRLGKILPFVGSMTMRNGMATAYVCHHFTCREPVTTVEGLRAELRGQQTKGKGQKPE